MNEVVIKVSNLSKRYRIGYRTKQSDTLTGRMLQLLRSPITNYKRLRSMNRFDESDRHIHWALKDINFEVKRGEVLGIIGHNGAGKSTLLKILSRITPPTEGEIEVTGRVSSLLEVGTGFHPELTGRDNIFMNGTIHGMRKKEINFKLDEIINFSGIEKYIDTPVKFYSSGMKVRLGFAVAAHLEPEILVIDEVLAVGDAEFQKKCLGKMKNVSESGRTVLFVSHDMNSVLNLCSSAILLKSGKIDSMGSTVEVIGKYVDNLKDSPGVLGNEQFRIKDVQLNSIQINQLNGVRCGEPFALTVIINSLNEYRSPHLKFIIKDSNGVPVTVLSNIYTGVDFKKIEPGEIQITCKLLKTPFSPGSYRVDLEFRNELKLEFRHYDAFSFEVLDADFYNSGKMMKNKAKGVMLESTWHVS